MKPDKFYLDMVAALAARSKDTARGVGCVIVDYFGDILSAGYNELANGTQDNAERRAHPLKLLFTEHAERNAIYYAARHGVALRESIMFQNSFPCADCARAIVQSGITQMVCSKPDFTHHRWGESFRAAEVILREGGVTLRYI